MAPYIFNIALSVIADGLGFCVARNGFGYSGDVDTNAMTEIKSVRLLKHPMITRVLINEDDENHRYQMSIPSIDIDDNGSLGWRLAHHEHPTLSDIHSAISIMSSYEYLLSSCINMTEATNRLRCLRRAYQHQHDDK